MKVKTTRFGYGCAVIGLSLTTTSPAYAATEKKTIGLVLVGFHIAMHQTEGAKDECPDGMQFSSLDQFNAQYPDEKERERQLMTSGYLDNRGPNGENVTYQPGLIKDPLPLREVQSKIGMGANLDGTPNGAETAKTCKHQKFTSPNGTQTDIDNQLYRVVGCLHGFRRAEHLDNFLNLFLVSNVQNRVLIEIADVDDEINDDEVKVTFYKGIDKLVLDGKQKPFPWQSQRIDRKAPEYTQHTTGKIVNGELMTEAMPKYVRQYIWATFAVGEDQIMDMRLRLKLGPSSAEGLMVGYSDIKKWYFLYSKIASRSQEIARYSAPTMWEGLRRHADGYKDTETGQCTAISTAYKIEAVRAFIVKDGDPAITAGTTNTQAARQSK